MTYIEIEKVNEFNASQAQRMEMYSALLKKKGESEHEQNESRGDQKLCK